MSHHILCPRNHNLYAVCQCERLESADLKMELQKYNDNSTELARLTAERDHQLNKAAFREATIAAQQEQIEKLNTEVTRLNEACAARREAVAKAIYATEGCSLPWNAVRGGLLWEGTMRRADAALRAAGLAGRGVGR